MNGFLALVLLGFVWLARPRLGPTEGTVVTAQQAPGLHALIKGVAEGLKVPPPTRVTLTSEVNASSGYSGFPPKPALGLGLPLWYGLQPQERVAVIAHESAHQRNGDPARGTLIWVAMSILANAVDVLRPRGEHYGARGVVQLAMLLSGWVMMLVSLIPLGLLHALTTLIGADQQGAEFRADLMAAQVAGTQPTASMLDKLHLGYALESALQKQKHRPERPHAFLELRHIWDSLSPQQRA